LFVNNKRKWKLRAESEKVFKDWIDRISRAFRPRWVEQSASRCWVFFKFI